MELLAWGNTVMEPHLFRIKPRAGSGESYAHEGEEFLFVLRGELKIALADEEYHLKRGDSFYFESATPHRWKNPGSQRNLAAVDQYAADVLIQYKCVCAATCKSSREGGAAGETKIMTRKSLIVCFVTSLILLCGSCARKTPTLNLLVWEGYADPSYVKAFEEQNHCKVSASYMGSSDELVAKLRGGSSGNYDIISPSSDVATMITTSGLAAALDLGKLPSYSQLSPQLISLPLVRVKGEVYGVPFMWGPDPMIYDTTAFPQPPTVGTYVGSEVEREDFCVGRSLHRLHGGAGSGLRQARSGASL